MMCEWEWEEGGDVCWWVTADVCFANNVLKGVIQSTLFSFYFYHNHTNSHFTSSVYIYVCFCFLFFVFIGTKKYRFANFVRFTNKFLHFHFPMTCINSLHFIFCLCTYCIKTTMWHTRRGYMIWLRHHSQWKKCEASEKWGLASILFAVHFLSIRSYLISHIRPLNSSHFSSPSQEHWSKKKEKMKKKEKLSSRQNFSWSQIALNVLAFPCLFSLELWLTLFLKLVMMCLDIGVESLART